MSEEITTKTACTITGISYDVLKGWTRRGSIPVKRLGTGLPNFVRLTDINEYILRRHKHTQALKKWGYTIIAPEWAKEETDETE